MTLEEAAANIGRTVVYQPALGQRETGVITDVGTRWVWVRYGDRQGSQATDPGHLQLETP